VPALELLRRIGIGRALPWASLASAIGFGLVGASAGFTGGAIAIVTLTAGEVLFNPAHQTAVAEAADPAHRGRAYGIAAFVQMVGIAVAPLLGGVLLDTIGHHHAAMWLAIAGIGVAQAACFARFVRRRTGHHIAAAADAPRV
jgi:MFS family permease